MDPSFLTILKGQRQCWTRPVKLMCGGAWGGAGEILGPGGPRQGDKAYPKGITPSRLRKPTDWMQGCLSSLGTRLRSRATHEHAMPVQREKQARCSTSTGSGSRHSCGCRRPVKRRREYRPGWGEERLDSKLKPRTGRRTRGSRPSRTNHSPGKKGGGCSGAGDQQHLSGAPMVAVGREVDAAGLRKKAASVQWTERSADGRRRMDAKGLDQGLWLRGEDCGNRTAGVGGA